MRDAKNELKNVQVNAKAPGLSLSSLTFVVLSSWFVPPVVSGFNGWEFGGCDVDCCWPAESEIVLLVVAAAAAAVVGDCACGAGAATWSFTWLFSRALLLSAR